MAGNADNAGNQTPRISVHLVPDAQPGPVNPNPLDLGALTRGVVEEWLKETGVQIKADPLVPDPLTELRLKILVALDKAYSEGKKGRSLLKR